MTRTGFLVASAAALLLAGCGETKLLSRTLPDETRVVDGPGLVVPPDYQLRPPREASDYETLLGERKTAEAQALITGVSGSVVVSGSVAEVPAADVWLVKESQQQSGVVADPNVRQALENETKLPEPEQKKSTWQRWFGSSDPKDE